LRIYPSTHGWKHGAAVDADGGGGVGLEAGPNPHSVEHRRRMLLHNHIF
jgi:hypothetical protein